MNLHRAQTTLISNNTNQEGGNTTVMKKNLEFAATRRALRLSQGRVARRAGVSQALLSQFELGNISLRPEQIESLEIALRSEFAQTSQQAAKAARQYGALGA
jgi:predicted transcriptional regulator